MDPSPRKIVIAGGALLSLTIGAFAARDTTAAASFSDLRRDAICGAAVERRLVEWGATAERYRDPDGPFSLHQWRIATREIGTWVLLNQPVDDVPSLARVDARSIERASFDSQCRESLAVETHPPPVVTAFSDADVRSLLSASPRGVIFVWSPHMPLSIDAYRTVAAVANRLQMTFTAVRDPMSDAAYAAAVASEANLPPSALRPFASVELSFRQATLHAPAVLVFANGRFAGLAVPGYREDAGFESAIAERLRAAPSAKER